MPFHCITTDYGFQHDSHVLTWWLWRATRELVAEATLDRKVHGVHIRYYGERFDPEDWTRYDGELL